jgi:hypothetical protein
LISVFFSSGFFSSGFFSSFFSTGAPHLPFFSAPTVVGGGGWKTVFFSTGETASGITGLTYSAFFPNDHLESPFSSLGF